MLDFFIELIRFLSKCLEIFSHSSMIGSSNSYTESYWRLFAYTWRAKWPHKFAVGFRFRLRLCQIKISILSFLNQLLIDLDTWHGALSYWSFQFEPSKSGPKGIRFGKVVIDNKWSPFFRNLLQITFPITSKSSPHHHRATTHLSTEEIPRLRS